MMDDTANFCGLKIHIDSQWKWAEREREKNKWFSYLILSHYRRATESKVTHSLVRSCAHTLWQPPIVQWRKWKCNSRRERERKNREKNSAFFFSSCHQITKWLVWYNCLLKDRLGGRKLSGKFQQKRYKLRWKSPKVTTMWKRRLRLRRWWRCRRRQQFV